MATINFKEIATTSLTKEIVCVSDAEVAALFAEQLNSTASQIAEITEDYLLTLDPAASFPGFKLDYICTEVENGESSVAIRVTAPFKIDMAGSVDYLAAAHLIVTEALQMM